jgi:hypothetical protein
MGDPRLNSVHLSMPRRQHFRRARDVLLGARGDQTFVAERQQDDGPGGSGTIIQPADGQGLPGAPPGLDFWLEGSDQNVYPLKVGLNTLGRSPDNDVVVEDAFTSRRHCAILVHLRSGCELHDTASKNGTYLNGARLARPTRLSPGDEIRVCDQRFTFRSRPGLPEVRDTMTLMS